MKQSKFIATEIVSWEEYLDIECAKEEAREALDYEVMLYSGLSVN